MCSRTQKEMVTQVNIPRIIHRIWLDDPMPELFVAYGKRWRELHPGWEVREWRDSRSVPPLRNQELFDRARDVCPQDWKRFQADLLRLELLWQHGGVYSDTDVEPLRPFGPLLRPPGGAFAAWSANTRKNGERPITQAILGATQQHPFIAECLEQLPDSIRQYGDRPLAQMIGPWHLTRIYRAMAQPGITIHPPELFYPQSDPDRDAGRAVSLDGAYAWHRWNSSLRRQGRGLG